MTKQNNITPEQRTAFFETYGIRVLKSLRRIIRAVDIHSKKLSHEHKITAPQMICLYSLQKNGPMTQSALAQDVDLGMSTVNGIIDRLHAKGWIQRERDKVDRRKVFLELTESGTAQANEAPALLQDKLSEALQALPELEQAAIALSLERIVELMGVGHLEASSNLIPTEQIPENPSSSSPA
ncbi:MarR family winged helix-turn-helix transcriptional regulator [Pontiella agarivorans]|uniref:MarR family transcriptional regulator n=1 Tax=Pontiella agarivorans TaxID=3038953 RepID=A0ABU5MTV6_9BACT|nr:MarR family transcriptional regulator [Pontiella agarivorans]MDZ8117655.1 MarR family transcriptional regulator [Pontiella agarivorans]